MAAKQSNPSHGAWRPGKEPINLYRDGLREALGRSGKTLAAMCRALNEHGAGVLDAPDEAVKVWSDLHLGHANIIAYQGRPFHDVHEMDGVLWANWQLSVNPEDTLVCVGDVAMGSGITEDTWERVRAAPGSPKVLVVGNHDLTGQGILRAAGFHRVKAVLTSPGDPPLIWTHAPLPNVPVGHVNIHGHQHSALKPADSPHINVSVEQLDYRPVSLVRIRRLAKALVAGKRPEGATTLERVEEAERNTTKHRLRINVP